MKPIVTTILLLSAFIANHLQAGQPDFKPDFTAAYRQYEAIKLRFDTDGDDQLSYEELIEAFHAPQQSREQYQAIRLYLVNFDTLQTTGTARISQNSLIQANFSGQQLLYNHEKDVLFWNSWLSHPDRSDYADIYRSLLPHGLTSITPDNILQNQYTDCVLIATLASIANSETGKRLILQYFQVADSDGLYITFPGVTAQSYYARLDDIVANNKLATARDGGLWPGVIETAFAFLPKNWKFKYRDHLLAQIEFREFAKLHSVDSGLAFDVLAGASIEVDNIQLQTEEHLAQQLEKIIKEDRIAWLGLISAYSHFDTGLMSGRFPQHAYSIIGYDEAHQQVLIRDPYGNSEIFHQELSVLPHKTNTFGTPRFVYEYVHHTVPKNQRESILFTEEEARWLANSTAKLSSWEKSAFQSAVDGKVRTHITSSVPVSVNSETAQSKTGIVRISLDEALHLFNHLIYTTCGLSYCFP